MYGCSHRSDAEKGSFSASLPMLYNVGAGKDCAGKIDTINLDMNDPEKRKTRPDSTEFSLFFVTWASAPHSSSNRQLARP